MTRDQLKSGLKTEIKRELFFYYYFFKGTLKDNLTAKNGDVSLITP